MFLKVFLIFIVTLFYTILYGKNSMYYNVIKDVEFLSLIYKQIADGTTFSMS